MYNSNHRPQILSNKFLNDLYTRSIAYTNDATERKEIETYIGFIEDYVQGLQDYGYMNSKNKKAIINQISQLSAISSLPPNMRGIYGMTDPSSRTIYVNPKLPGNGILNSRERSKLYAFHELGHLAHMIYSNDINNFTGTVQRTNKLSDKATNYVIMGFDLIDEVTVQDTAETIAYGQSKKERPNFRSYKIPTGREGYFFGKDNIVTNFDYYGELEVPAALFTLPIRGIGCTSEEFNISTMIRQLSKRSFEPNFVQDIIAEFDECGERDALICILNRMGIIKDASYALFGSGTYSSSLSITEEAYNVIKSETRRLMDQRPRKYYSGLTGQSEQATR